MFCFLIIFRATLLICDQLSIFFNQLRHGTSHTLKYLVDNKTIVNKSHWITSDRSAGSRSVGIKGLLSK